MLDKTKLLLLPFLLFFVGNVSCHADAIGRTIEYNKEENVKKITYSDGTYIQYDYACSPGGSVESGSRSPRSWRAPCRRGWS